MALASLAQIQEIPPRIMLMLVGPLGAGKSTFIHQTVYNNLIAKKPVIFVTTDCAPSIIIRILQEKGLDEMPSGLLYFVDAFHETVGLSTTSRPDTINSSCRDLTSIEVAILKLQDMAQGKNILLVFDSLTSPYLLNGQNIIQFIRISIAKFSAEGNSVLLCIDEGCCKEEDIGAMMSIVNGLIKMKAEDGSIVLNIVKHPVVKPGIITIPRTDGITTTPSVPTIDSLESLNEKIDWLVNRINYLEAILAESRKYPEVIDFLEGLRMGTALYGQPLKTLASLISSRHLMESTSQQDEISRIILNVIALKGPRNISQLTREVNSRRGKSSRTTVRDRLSKLLQSEVLIKEGNYYRLSDRPIDQK